jgi:hypothetical protein
MTAIRKTASATASAGRSALRAPRKTAVRKTAVRKTVVKTPARSKATTPDAATSPRSASVAARLATIAKTRKPIDAAVVLDPSDGEGQRRAAQALARAEAAATKAATATTTRKTTTKTALAKKTTTKKTTTKKTTAKKTTTKTTVTKKAAAPNPTTETATTDTKAPRTRGPSGVTRSAAERVNDPLPETGLVLLNRVLGKIEQEILRIESIVDRRGGKVSQRTEAERRARTLASLTKTLAELRRLRANDELQRPLDDDAIPRDLDEFRRALSRRLEQLVADPAQPAAAGHE